MIFKSKPKKFEGVWRQDYGKRLHYPTESEKYLGVKIDVNQAVQWVFCVWVINHLCKQVFKKTVQAIYCPP